MEHVNAIMCCTWWPINNTQYERLGTVNLEIFARVLFSRNFADAAFRENKTLAKWRKLCVIY